MGARWEDRTARPELVDRLRRALHAVGDRPVPDAVRRQVGWRWPPAPSEPGPGRGGEG